MIWEIPAQFKQGIRGVSAKKFEVFVFPGFAIGKSLYLREYRFYFDLIQLKVITKLKREEFNCCQLVDKDLGTVRV